MKSFNEIFEDKTKYCVKVVTSEYGENGKNIIVDQGQGDIAGYTDREEGLFSDVPVIIFGDHTRIIKYVDKPFFLGADGVKVIKCKDLNANYKYLFYALKNARIPDTGYNRHFKWLKAVKIKYPDYREQEKIVQILDLVNDILKKRKTEIEFLNDLTKARFVEMFDLSECVYGTFGKDTDFVDYRGKTPELSDVGTIRMVNAKSVGKGVFKTVNEYVTDEVYEKWMHRGLGYPGDILFVTEGHTFGNTCLVPDYLKKFALGQRVITIKGHSEVIDNAFLGTYMQMEQFKQDIDVYKTGGTAQGIRSKDLLKIRLPLPKYKEQKEFADFIKQVDKSKVVHYI